MVEVIAEHVGMRTEKAKGFMHWISPMDSVDCTVRLFDHIISAYNPNEAKNFIDIINPNSLTLMKNAKINKAAV